MIVRIILALNLRLTRQEGLRFGLIAVTAGAGQMVVSLVDRQKLLERDVPVTVAIVDAPVKP
jgi:hypothetical protein